jgi:hypothetical protein
MDDRSSTPSEVGRLRHAVDALDQRSRSVTSPKVRHDLSNAIGAARNALQLVIESPELDAHARFMEIAQRNVDRATRLLDGPADGGSSSSGRNERDDLGRASERNHRETFGL